MKRRLARLGSQSLAPMSCVKICWTGLGQFAQDSHLTCSLKAAPVQNRDPEVLYASLLCCSSILKPLLHDALGDFDTLLMHLHAPALMGDLATWPTLSRRWMRLRHQYWPLDPGGSLVAPGKLFDHKPKRWG